MSANGNENEIGGSHYKSMKYDVMWLSSKINLEGNVFSLLKYYVRHKSKNGLEDIEKGIHMLSYVKANCKPSLKEYNYGQDLHYIGLFVNQFQDPIVRDTCNNIITLNYSINEDTCNSIRSVLERARDWYNTWTPGEIVKREG